MSHGFRVAGAALALIIAGAGTSASAASTQFAVWLDGNTSAGGGGNGILTSLDNAFGAGHYTLVSTADLETTGFLSPFGAIVVSRFGSAFGTSMSALAASNVAAYVGSGPGQGGVAVFTNDASDNLFGSTSGDPFDANLDRLFTNSATFALSSGHGYIGEFNGAVMALASNTAGFASIGLLTGSASAVRGFGSLFTYDVGPIGPGHPIDAGVTFPFTDSDGSTFLTDITGADPTNIVDIYTSAGISGEPAVLANATIISGGVPEPASWALMLVGFAGLGATLRGSRRKAVIAV